MYLLKYKLPLFFILVHCLVYPVDVRVDSDIELLVEGVLYLLEQEVILHQSLLWVSIIESRHWISHPKNEMHHGSWVLIGGLITINAPIILTDSELVKVWLLIVWVNLGVCPDKVGRVWQVLRVSIELVSG